MTTLASRAEKEKMGAGEFCRQSTLSEVTLVGLDLCRDGTGEDRLWIEERVDGNGTKSLESGSERRRMRRSRKFAQASSDGWPLRC